MKKFISLALAAAMTLSLVPVSAFASTDNRISNVVTVEKDTELKTTAPKIQITDDKDDLVNALEKNGSTVSFELVLDGAEWVEGNMGSDVTVTTDSNVTGKIEKLTSTRALVTLTSGSEGKKTFDSITIALAGAKVTGDTAKVTIDPKNSTVSADTFTFAKSVNGSTITTVEKKVDIRDQGAIKDILIEETVAGTFEKGKDITLKLNSGFKFVKEGTVTVATGTKEILDGAIKKTDDRTLTLTLGNSTKTSVATILRFAGIEIATDGAKVGNVAEITVSGAGVEKTTVEVGTVVDYGTKVTVADKDLPTIYSGSKVADSVKAVSNDDNETLLITVQENTADSWLLNRKTTFTFPEGVKVVGVTVDKDTENIKNSSSSAISASDFDIDENEVTLSNLKNDTTNKAKLVVKFDLHVDPGFTGDIKCTVGGAALSEDTAVTVAKAVSPVTVEAAKTSVAIDYRNVAVGDITVKEAKAGLWGKDQTIVLRAENMTFESGLKAEVTEGDGEIKDLKVDKGLITITVKSESSKTPMSIKLTNASLYLDRTLPAGDYALDLVYSGSKDVLFENYKETENKVTFDTDKVTVMKDYVTVATSGRDQGTTFTTNVAVTIDSTKMIVDGKEVTLDVPAYLSAEGWTMLPVRAVTEALASASNNQPIDWIAGNPGTIMIYYGDKTVAMTLGSTTMYINGTPVPMSTAPVIVNDRAFLPMRDLGRALGLSDDQIAWDAATRTATFNPAK